MLERPTMQWVLLGPVFSRSVLSQCSLAVFSRSVLGREYAGNGYTRGTIVYRSLQRKAIGQVLEFEDLTF